MSRFPHFQGGIIKSAAYTEAGRGPGGWSLNYDDIMSGVDELIRRGIVDSGRMGLYGFSNGGGSVYYLVTETNRFKCAVDLAGVTPDMLGLPLLDAPPQGPS